MAALEDRIEGQDPASAPMLSELVPQSSRRRKLLVGISVAVGAFAFTVIPQEGFQRSYNDVRHTRSLDGGRRTVHGPVGHRSQAATVALGDGRVLIWGGRGVSVDSGNIYDPVKETWEHLPAAPGPPRSAAATAWTGHEALIWGGSTNAGADLDAGGIAYNPSSGTWRQLPDAPVGLEGARAISLEGGVLMAGGVPKTLPSKPVSLWLDLGENAWTVVPAPLFALHLVRDRTRALATGPQGITMGRPHASDWPVFAFDPARMTWEQVAGPLHTEWMVLAVGGDGTLSAVTLEGLNEPLRAYEWAGGAWDKVAETAEGARPVITIEIRLHPPVTVWTGEVLLVGGQDGLTSWDPSARRFATRSDSALRSFGGTAVWTGSAAVALSSQSSRGWVWTPEAS